MLINFLVGDIPVEFSRDQMTGRAEVKTQGGTLVLDNPLNPATHVSLSLTKEWRFNIGGTNVLIEKKRPLLLAGFRPSRYRVIVEGTVVAEQTGT